MGYDPYIFLGIAAGFLQFVGYLLYTHDVVKSGVRPNPASWLIWSYGNGLVCLSYIVLNEHVSPAVDILPIVCSISSILMSVSFFFLGKFRPLDTFEKLIVLGDICITILWTFSEFGNFSLVPLKTLHLLLLLSAVISFIPLYREVIRDHMVERPLPWVVWTVAYTLLVYLAIREGGSSDVLVYPILYVALHGLVVLFSSRRMRKLIFLPI